MSYKKPLGDPNITQKRLIANPKYERVAATVDAGVNANTAKVIRENEVSVKQQKGELFKRMRPSSLANALTKKLQELQLEAQMAQMSEEEANHLRIAMGQNLPGGVSGGVVDQNDAVMRQHQMEYQLPKAPRKEIVVVDIRDREDFEQCHIGSALCYPHTKLSHAMHHFPPELLKYKNKENALVVMYDLEEELTVAKKCANIFVERGFDNIAVLSGGLKEFVQEHSAMIVGESPVPIIPKPAALIHGRRTLANRTNTSSVSGSTLGTSVATSHKPKSLTSSLARPRSNVSNAGGGGAWH